MDALNVNESAIGTQVGSFYGSPIYSYIPEASEAQATAEARRQAALSRVLGDGVSPELLPGEVVCTDGIIRRTTTAEHQGPTYDDFKAPEDAIKLSLEDAKKRTEEGAFIHWRPRNEEYALLYTDQVFDLLQKQLGAQ